MFNIWFWIALGIALVDWIAVEKCWDGLIYLAKPGVMVALLVWLATAAGYSAALLPFYLGIFLSLLGDVFLMLPREQFIAGLVSFLLAHVAYIIGLNHTFPPLGVVPALLAIGVLLAGWQIFLRLSKGLTGKNRKLRTPVFLYAVVISIMLLSALVTLSRPDWNLTAALVISAGALLFYLSDTLLAWRKFVRHFAHDRLIGIIPYHLGQIAIIAGAILQFRVLALM